MINGIPETKEEYDAIINPDEYARRMAIIKQGMLSATARSASKKRMIENIKRRIKRQELSDKYGC